MTKRFWPLKTQFLLAALVILFASLTGFSQEEQPWSINNSPLPAPTGFVNDYAGVIDSVTKQQLESKLKNLRDTTNPSVEIAVAVVRTTGDRPIFDYSMAVARGWKIGSKEDDNPAALLFIAVDDRKYFTQVSRNLEDELPDGLVGNLQRQYLVPEFKKGNYGKGISDTIDSYIAAIQTESTGVSTNQPPETESGGPGGGSMSGIFCCAVILLVILIAIFGRSKGGRSKKDRDRWGGGGFGGGGGGGDALPIVMGILGGMLSGGSGGSSSSSNWGGSSGGSDWGGFGGGGDFGGGGGGGDW